ncbi:hypothetical protein VMCG_00622 [Cytospora schulzeri]|uniref:Uncharacterized protein n=1 Tax=Cytospora schulzeri TaxID=448051 RepID=A0A423X9H6_9PEZI|nr:hypothetical protein VMCG_00622 [Valsa malicola]
MAPNNVNSCASTEPVAEIKVEVTGNCGSMIVSKTIPLYANKTVRVGRDLCNNEFEVDDPTVSRNHLEFYSIVFDNGPNHFPLVYVRDRQSNIGTRVNDEYIKDTDKITPARLLQHGDKVYIPPHVTFELIQPFAPTLKLSPLQSEEAKQYFRDRYTVLDRTLGDGASAHVHLAIDSETGEQLACKVYDLCQFSTLYRDDLSRSLSQEAFFRCQMEHPNIASFRGAYKSPSTLYVFEDLATGGDLFSLMERDRKFTESDVRFMIHQVVRAIAYMHEKGVAHRDLKLENILCAICPKPGHRLVITDFGHSGAVSLTPMDHIVGTEGWQAPEILKPPHRHGPPVDMWSIGVLATQLLAGTSKIDALDLLHAFAKSPGDMKEPTNELDRIFDDLERIRYEYIQPDAISFIRRCFQVNPNDRLTAAEAMEHRWLCVPADDHKLFLRREKEITAGWKRREVLGDAVKDLPDLRMRMANGSLSFTPKEHRPGLHALRRTAECNNKGDRNDNKKRSRMQDITMLPQYQTLERRLRLMSTTFSHYK